MLTLGPHTSIVHIVSIFAPYVQKAVLMPHYSVSDDLLEAGEGQDDLSVKLNNGDCDLMYSMSSYRQVNSYTRL